MCDRLCTGVPETSCRSGAFTRALLNARWNAPFGIPLQFTTTNSHLECSLGQPDTDARYIGCTIEEAWQQGISQPAPAVSPAVRWQAETYLYPCGTRCTYVDTLQYDPAKVSSEHLHAPRAHRPAAIYLHVSLTIRLLLPQDGTRR